LGTPTSIVIYPLNPIASKAIKLAKAIVLILLLNTNLLKMKKLLVAFALLLCFTTQAQNSFKLKVGSVLTYEVQEDTTLYNLIVTVENLSPIKLSYTSTKKSRKGTFTNSIAKADDAYDYDFFMPIPISKPIPKGSATGSPILLSKASYEKIQRMEKVYRAAYDADDMAGDTATASIVFARKKSVTFANIGFESEGVTVNGEELRLHTYAIDEKIIGKEDEDFIGYIMRVNIDSDYPYVTYINDGVNKFSIMLKEAKDVELYEYMR
jgi:flagellar capping protein FliD